MSTIAIGVKDVEVYGKVQVTLQPMTPSLCPFYGLIVTLKEKPVLELDLDLPLGLEGTVSTGSICRIARVVCLMAKVLGKDVELTCDVARKWQRATWDH